MFMLVMTPVAGIFDTCMTSCRSIFLIGMVASFGWLSGVNAQWMEDFSEGDLSTGPTLWTGDLAHFKINPAQQLQLMAPGAGTSRISTWQFIPDSARWDFFVRLDFSPSNANLVGIALMTDQEDFLTGNGYYLEAGETGSSDAFHFYRLDGGQRTLLASGTAGSMGGNAAVVRARMERRTSGLWTFLADYTGGWDFKEEFTVQDTVWPTGSEQWFGIGCTYTSTRTDKYYFDDLGINPLLPDTTAPTLIDVQIVDDQELHLRFSEPLREEEVSEPEHYDLQPGPGQPSLVEWQPYVPAEVRLVWSSAMQNFASYTLKISGLADTAGNVMDTMTHAFTFLQPRIPVAGQLLINEIMADPNPPVALPDAEYVELLNTGNQLLDLTGLKISTSSASATLPAAWLYPDSFIILVRPEFTDLFAPYGTTLGVPSLPQLPNDGTRLMLETSTGQILHEVTYRSDWHPTTTKREGGWSLELTSPSLKCALTGNWQSAVAPAGGTPGRINSTYHPATDSTGPVLLRVWPVTASRLLLTFDERLSALPDSGWITLDPARTILSIQLEGSGHALTLDLDQPLEPGVTYRVSPSGLLTDCLGNSAPEGQSVRVALPELPAPGDLLINEILFNPPTGGSDFVELYNASDKVLSLEALLLGNMVPGREEIRPIARQALCFPEDHVVLTGDTAFIRQYWPEAEPSLLFPATLPAWLNDSGNVTLFVAQGPDLEVLDAMDYHEDMHYALLRDEKGVSLERLSPSLPGADRSNWHSAAEETGFATPTRRNSQTFEPAEGEPSPFVLVDVRFSPDGDGWQDQLVVQYRFAEAGTVLNARVFDRAGRHVRELADTRLLGREGVITWSGDTDGGMAAPPGAYVLWLETYSLSGKRRQYKYPVVLVLPLD